MALFPAPYCEKKPKEICCPVSKCSSCNSPG